MNEHISGCHCRDCRRPPTFGDIIAEAKRLASDHVEDVVNMVDDGGDWATQDPSECPGEIELFARDDEGAVIASAARDYANELWATACAAHDCAPVQP